MDNLCEMFACSIKKRTFDVINVHIIAKNLKIKSSRCLKREEIGHLDVAKQLMAKETLTIHTTARNETDRITAIVCC